MNETSETVSAALLEIASDWFLRVRAADAGSPDHVAWLAWIEADPAHRAAFAQIQDAWDVAGAIENPPWPTSAELARGAGSSTEDVSGSNKGASPQIQPPAPVTQRLRQSRNRIAWSALAAGIAVAAVLMLPRLDWSGRPDARITTGRGEQQATLLPDGSRVELGGMTGVAVTYTPQRRLIVADEGEAFYQVARDAARPFVVKSGPVSVTAVGTAFSVRREGESVSIVVSEGIVEVDVARESGDRDQVSAVRATAGERVRYERGDRSPVVEEVQTRLATAWRRGRLSFEEEPLRVVVASLNRYSSREILIEDPSLAELRFTGTVFDDRVQDWLSSVQVVFPVALREEADRIVIERATPD